MKEKILSIINKISPYEITIDMMKDKFETLSFSSLDRVNLLIEIEEEFDIIIDESNLIDIVFDDTLESFILSIEKVINKELGEKKKNDQ